MSPGYRNYRSYRSYRSTIGVLSDTIGALSETIGGKVCETILVPYRRAIGAIGTIGLSDYRTIGWYLSYRSYRTIGHRTGSKVSNWTIVVLLCYRTTTSPPRHRGSFTELQTTTPPAHCMCTTSYQQSMCTMAVSTQVTLCPHRDCYMGIVVFRLNTRGSNP